MHHRCKEGNTNSIAKFLSPISVAVQLLALKAQCHEEEIVYNGGVFQICALKPDD